MRTWRQILADPKFRDFTSVTYLAITAGANTTTKLYNLTLGASAIDAFKESTNELTRRLISKGITSNAGFSTDAEFQYRWIQIFNKIHETQDEYDTLITYQKNNINKLNDELRAISNSTTRFNDTPQSRGDYSGTDYTSTITTNSSESIIPVNVADKLEIARKALNDIYNRWLREFETFFIYNYDFEDNDDPFIPPVIPEPELYKHHLYMRLEYLENVYDVKWTETDQHPKYTIETYPAVGDFRGLNIGNAILTKQVTPTAGLSYLVSSFNDYERTEVEVYDYNDESFSMQVVSFQDNCIKL